MDIEIIESSSSEEDFLLEGRYDDNLLTHPFMSLRRLIQGDSPIDLSPSQLPEIDMMFSRPGRFRRYESRLNIVRPQCMLMKRIMKLAQKMNRENSEDLSGLPHRANTPVWEKFLIYMLELGKKANENTGDLVKFLKMMEKLPDRVRVMKAIKKMSPIHYKSDNILLICLRLLEYKYEALDSPVSKVSNPSQI